ncbi:unnamed protein product [Calicophoron daubneyi]|uniref:Insulin-degrading enzyme n=1 Tax=Calicophoron daubneyi TaxID=300641 RepID=A0AAV2TLN0_CALDB
MKASQTNGIQAGEGEAPDVRDVIDVPKSSNDSREYRAFILSNGMRVIVVNDPETDKAAACLTVNTGSMCDPRQLPGLAHFCEHMLFLGTEKYPVENTYSKFIADHGGVTNGSTKPDETSFSFDVSAEYLEAALDIFAQFFICPLFTLSAMEREINAVQAEFEKNMTNDSRRLFQLERSLSIPGHDYSRFFSGNRHSLFHSACARGTNLGEQLLKFHERYYSANLMTLAVLGKHSLDDLQAMVEKLFGPVVNRDTPRPFWSETPWTEDVLKKRTYMCPVTEANQLHIMWPIADLSEEYKYQPTAYITHLLGHEGRGSLLSALKKISWVNRLSCGVSRPGKGFACLILSIDLTEIGLGHVDDIILKVYQYLDLLRNNEPQQWIFEEIKALNLLNFTFKDKEPPYAYVTQLSSNLLRYNTEDVLTGPYILTEFLPGLVRDVVCCLNPENARVFILSKSFCSMCTEVERWYGTRYLCVDIPEEQLQTWRYCGYDKQLFLPERNPYIASDFSIYPLPPDAPKKSPDLLFVTGLTRLWHFQDPKFNLPKSFITFHFISPLSFSNPLKTLLTALYVELFQDLINENAYNSMLAGMTVEARRTTQGIKLSFSGFSHKMGILIQDIIRQLIDFTSPDVDRFRALREELSREIVNFSIKPAYQQCGVYLTNVITDRSWINEELASAYQSVTIDRMVTFIPQFYGNIFVEILAYGNVTTKEAIGYRELVENALIANFNSDEIKDLGTTMAREIILPENSNYIFQRTTVDQPTSGIVYYLQCPQQNTRSDTVLNLLCEVINEPAFTRLRTEQQLGYIIFTGARRSNVMQGFRVILQSTFRPDELEQYIEDFLTAFQNILKEMPHEEFVTHVESLKSRLMEKPKGMTEQNERFWCEIACHHYNFDRRNLEIQELKKVNHKDLIQFFETWISPASAKRKKISVYVTSEQRHGCDLRLFRPVNKGELVKDHKKLKLDLPKSGVATPFMPLIPKSDLIPSDPVDVSDQPLFE